MFIWCALTFLISFDISLDFEMKRKKKRLFSSKSKKRGKKFDTHPAGIEPEPADPESSALTHYARGTLHNAGSSRSCILQV